MTALHCHAACCRATLPIAGDTEREGVSSIADVADIWAIYTKNEIFLVALVGKKGRKCTTTSYMEESTPICLSYYVGINLLAEMLAIGSVGPIFWRKHLDSASDEECKAVIQLFHRTTKKTTSGRKLIYWAVIITADVVLSIFIVLVVIHLILFRDQKSTAPLIRASCGSICVVFLHLGKNNGLSTLTNDRHLCCTRTAAFGKVNTLILGIRAILLIEAKFLDRLLKKLTVLPAIAESYMGQRQQGLYVRD
eukprot:GHVU01030421.1.p1 GENE.GHVU01030421.1~~GHVU01030421.1.p1  ORF type:complete len:251 (+),score=10.26 GHVU01030421.1:432-1184(+)